MKTTAREIAEIVAEARAAEREACAKIADAIAGRLLAGQRPCQVDVHTATVLQDAAAAIRGRKA